MRIHTSQKVEMETAYDITNHQWKAQTVHQAIRKHWHIENKLPWDALMKEDTHTPKCGLAPIHLSLVKSIVINLFKRNGYEFITKAARTTVHDIEKASKYKIRLMGKYSILNKTVPPIWPERGDLVVRCYPNPFASPAQIRGETPDFNFIRSGIFQLVCSAHFPSDNEKAFL